MDTLTPSDTLDSGITQEPTPPQTKNTKTFSFTTLLRHLCYPLLMLAVCLTLFIGFTFEIDFGLCNMVFLVGTIAYLALCERLIPYKKQWHPTAKEWGRDAIYLILTMMGGASAVAVVFAIAAAVSPAESTLGLWLEVPIAILLTSLGSYIFHRAGHDIPFLWRFHGIHHAADKINVSNNALNHIADVFGRRLLAQLPLILLGISTPALFIVSIFNTAQGYFSHANVDVKIGWLNYIVGSPEQHRLHHSKDLAEAGHFSVDITLWDFLFKSYFWKKGKQPKEIGVTNRASFPPSNNIWKNIIHPLRRNITYRQ